MWCFRDRATPATDAQLERMESGADGAVVPWVWQIEVGNALGKAVVKSKVSLPRALEIWDELLLLPIRPVAIGNIPELMQLAVKHNLALYDTCYLQAAIVAKLAIATNDSKLIAAALANGLSVLVP